MHVVGIMIPCDGPTRLLQELWCPVGPGETDLIIERMSGSAQTDIELERLLAAAGDILREQSDQTEFPHEREYEPHSR